MFRASVGDGVAPRAGVYRHALVRRMIPLLQPLAAAAGTGWSPLAVALACVLMSWDAAPTLAQRFESALAVLDAALPRRRRVPRPGHRRRPHKSARRRTRAGGDDTRT